MTKAQILKRLVNNQIEPLKKDLSEYIDDKQKLEETLERISKIEEAVRELVKKPKTQDFFSDEFNGQF